MANVPTQHPHWCTRDRGTTHNSTSRLVLFDPASGSHAAVLLSQRGDEQPMIFLAVAGELGGRANIWLTLAQANLLSCHLADLVAEAGQR